MSAAAAATTTTTTQNAASAAAQKRQLTEQGMSQSYLQSNIDCRVLTLLSCISTPSTTARWVEAAQVYQSRRSELQGIASKIGELEGEADEHK